MASEPASQSGDEAVAAEWSRTVEETYRTLSRELWARFYSWCSDPERAHDAVQEAFTRLQQQGGPDGHGRRNGSEIRDLRAWLLRVGQNWLRDVARRKHNSNRQVERLDIMPSEDEDAHALLAGEEKREQVRQALSELKEDDRQVLVLRYSLNWSSQRIAESLEVSAAAVDMRLSRARKRLAEILTENGITHE